MPSSEKKKKKTRNSVRNPDDPDQNSGSSRTAVTYSVRNDVRIESLSGENPVNTDNTDGFPENQEFSSSLSGIFRRFRKFLVRKCRKNPDDFNRNSHDPEQLNRRRSRLLSLSSGVVGKYLLDSN